MIQRRQTVYITLSIIAMILYLVLPYAEVVDLGATESHQLETTKSTLVTIVSIASIALSIAAISQYKVLTRQYMMVMIALVLDLVVVGMLTYQIFVAQEKFKSFQLLWVGFMPTVSLLLLLLASRAIMKDAEILRNSDRLR